MDKKSIFNKGRQGHTRIVNSYRIFREKAKRWKYPLSGLVVVLMLMMSIDLAGDSLSVSVLESLEASKGGDSGISLTEENLEVAKKGFLMLLSEELGSCRDYEISECVKEGELLVARLDGIDTVEEANAFMAEVEEFGIRWSLSKDTIACQQNFEEAMLNLDATLSLFENQSGEASKQAFSLLQKIKEEFQVLAEKCGL